MQKPTKAIIAVAGYGTRRLPVTKSVEKCMLPLLNRPLIDYVVQDCVAAGVTDIYFVVSGAATQLRSYYQHDTNLESYLKRTGKEALIQSITPPDNIRFHFVEQDQQDPRYGTSVPVWLCRDYVAVDESVYVIMGDQHLYRVDGGSETADLAEHVQKSGLSVGLIGVPVPNDKAQFYGLLQLDESGLLTGIIENPDPQSDPSAYQKNASIYLVGGDFMPLLSEQLRSAPNQQGEYYITDAINQYIGSRPMVVYESAARYFDCGTVESWVAANNELLQLTIKQKTTKT